ncbi:hypothetical protein CFC21_009703 [Triticum aestivum]|uniref:Uncharacterized protein n=2 Tax=Triticum aestivum TaxID=4565 RepID=A0A3B5ZMB7_WHEAT|nr:hypothetical protein CFC21_009703 [Triticum aestivum]
MLSFFWRAKIEITRDYNKCTLQCGILLKNKYTLYKGMEGVINQAFPKGGHGSGIVTTTQIEDIAVACCCYHSEHVFEMKPLDDDHSKKLT